jgi:predicted HAD superfamily Cof-like phosphohydrolase
MEVTIDIPELTWRKAVEIADSKDELMCKDINEVCEYLLNTYVAYGSIREMGIDLEQGDSAWFDFTHKYPRYEKTVKGD